MKTFTSFVLMGLLAVVLSLGFNAIRPDGLSLIAKELVKTGAAGADTLAARKTPKLATVQFAEVDAMFAKEMAVFVDSRDEEKYNAGHIPGAVHLPVDGYRTKKVPFAMPKGLLLVVYCDGGDCELSHELADILVERGYQKVRIYTGGYEEWTQLSMPVETSK